MERTIKGTIKAWSKEIKERDNPMNGQLIYTIGLLIDENWHNIPSEDKAIIEKMKDEEAPLGSEVEFVEWKSEAGKYWNFKPESWKLIKKGDGQRPGGNNWNKPRGYFMTREEMIKEKASIQIQSILKAAVEQNKEGTDDASLKTAEKFLEWHNDTLLKQNSMLVKLYGPGPKTEEAKGETLSVTEEKVD